MKVEGGGRNPGASVGRQVKEIVRTPLHENWTVRRRDAGSDEAISALVPGCVHLDLLRAGLIPDPFVGMNELAVQWVGETDWVYESQFHVDDAPTPGERVDLVCEGLDTSARIYINGDEVGAVCNMHVRHRLNVTDAVRAGDNNIAIHFESPVGQVHRLAAEYGRLPFEGSGAVDSHPHNAIRKMACAFGWDWGPVLPTAGIWRPIRLERWAGARLGDVRPLVTHATAEEGKLDVHADIAFATEACCELRCEVLGPGGERVASARQIVSAEEPCAVRLSVVNPELWWPSGHGGQPLYEVCTRLLMNGQQLDMRVQRVGLRTVELIDEPDCEESPFGRGRTMHFRVNGERIFCKGANWIPGDIFPARMSAARYQELVRKARDANMNMLRVWGGGIYEDDAFYDACDEYGILVWQDILCSCAAYHESEPYCSWFEAEVRDNVSRLASHPSLVLWCGNNECEEAVLHWDSFQPLRDNPCIPWGRKYYNELFPQIVRELDPTRAYWPGSPHTPGVLHRPREESAGDAHIWDVWNGDGDARRYLMHAPRFASEFGFQGPPTWPTIEYAVPQDQRQHDSPAMRHHNKQRRGQILTNARVADYFDPPSNFDDWLYLAQVVQARSVAIGCEWFRALSPWCSGALYWQFNDVWPASSWSAIDSLSRPKPLWFATRRFFSPRLLTIRPTRPTSAPDEFGRMAVYLHNDDRQPWEATVHVEERDGAGILLRNVCEQGIVVDPGACAHMLLPEDATGEKGFLLASTECTRGYWFPKADRDMLYPSAELEFELEREGEAHRLHIRARTFVRDLCLFPERLHADASVSDQLLMMLPGDEQTLVVRSPRPLELDELVRPPVLQCVNRFGRRSRD